MQSYKINEVRSTLGSIMENILTLDFNTVYCENISNYQHCFPDIVLDYKEDIDRLVIEFAGALDSSDKIQKIIETTLPVLLICFFMRYHYLTMYLLEEKQTKLVNLPCDKTEFFIQLMNAYYLHGMSI